MVLPLGVDRFMSEARSITNTIGNAVGTMSIAKWVGAVDRERMLHILEGHDTGRETESIYAAPQTDVGSAPGLTLQHKMSA